MLLESGIHKKEKVSNIFSFFEYAAQDLRRNLPPRVPRRLSAQRCNFPIAFKISLTCPIDPIT